MNDLLKRLLGLQPDLNEPDGVRPTPEARVASESPDEAQSLGTKNGSGGEYADFGPDADEADALAPEAYLVTPEVVAEAGRQLARMLAPAIAEGIKREAERQREVESQRAEIENQRAVADLRWAIESSQRQQRARVP
jgi:hypothetical protein